MANKLIMKKSSVAAKVPLSTDLDVGEIAVNLVDQKLYSKKADGTVVLVGSGLGGSGDVQGAASSTDNAIVRFDGTNGKVIQNSSVTIDDSGNLSATTNSATGTGANKMPVGTTAQRPSTPQAGMYRMNSTSGMPEWYDATNSEWIPFSEPVQYEVEFVVVAGGGGAQGYNSSGGGGAGGYRSSVQGEMSGGGSMAENNWSVNPGTNYTVTVGAGGAGAYNGAVSTNGNNSVFGPVTSIGGGAGSNGLTPYGPAAPGSGGSGGGARADGGSSSIGGAGTGGQGFVGGNSGTYANGYPGGGGGGAGAAGGNGQGSSVAGDGGIGVASGITGASTYRAGGGGGSAQGGYTSGSGGLGGGGNAGSGATGSFAGSSGTANTGGGGGAGNSATGGNGGSGIVIVRYRGPQRGSGGTVTTISGWTVHTFTSSGTFMA